MRFTKPRRGFRAREKCFQEVRAPRLRVKCRDVRVEPLISPAFLPSHAGEERRKLLHAVRPPGPRTEHAELALRQLRQSVRLEFHKFWERKTGLLQAAEKFHGRTLRHEHHIILPSEKLRQVREVAHQLHLMLYRREGPAPRDETFRARIEEKHAGRAPLRARADVQLGDELRVKTRRPPRLHVQPRPLRALRRERKFQLTAEGVPVAFARRLPAAEPF